MRILTINTGSTSIKLDAFDADGSGADPVQKGRYRPGEGSPESLLETFLSKVGKDTIDAAVHRVVHGGAELVETCLIGDDTEKTIERLAEIAPLHNPIASRWIRASRQLLDVPQVAVFDTAFYARMPETASHYALPPALFEQHAVRRYGFHGIAHCAMWRRWRALRPDLPEGGRLISLQLGGGCSITAVKKGVPQDTSMGFSPVEGLVMASRSGDIDPSVIFYLMRHQGLTPEAVEQLLNKHSGLLGLSEKSADMPDLIDDPDPKCRLAVELYCYRARKYIGAYQAVLGGVDGIVFGGGVGEHMPEVRARILTGMQWCGIELDDEANGNALGQEARIDGVNSRVDIRVLPVNEAGLLIEEAYAMLQGS